MTPKQRRFVEEYTVDFNGTQAAIRAGYSAKTAHVQGSRLLTNVNISTAIQERVTTLQMSADEASIRMADAARFDIGPYVEREGRLTWIDVTRLIADGYGWVLKGLKYTPQGGAVWELWDGQRALEKIHGQMNPTKIDVTSGGKPLPMPIAILNIDPDKT